MVRFVVVGEGRPAKTLFDVLVDNPGATIDALVLKDPESNPLADAARQRGIAIFDVARIAAEKHRLAGGKGGWLVNANSTVVIPKDVLESFEGRSLNFHPGLLPQYAGLHTHQWAIRNGEHEFGVTVHRMEQRIDAGAIVGQQRFPIRPEDTGLSLFSRCLAAGAELFPRIVEQIVRGEPLPDMPQDLSLRRLYRHRDALDGRIDWKGSARQVIDFIRAGNYEPFASPTYVARLDAVAGFEVEVLRATIGPAAHEEPGAVVTLTDDGPLIACGRRDTVRIVKARRGRKPMGTAEWREYLSHLRDSRLLGRDSSEH